MVPKRSERRHRLNPVEIDPVKDACYYRLLHLLEERAPENLLEAQTLFRVWYRIHIYCTSKPAYPIHDNWNGIATNILNIGTVSRVEGNRTGVTTFSKKRQKHWEDYQPMLSM